MRKGLLLVAALSVATFSSSSAASARTAKYTDATGKLTVKAFGIADDEGAFVNDPAFTALRGNTARKIVPWWTFLPAERDRMCDAIWPLRVNQLHARTGEAMLTSQQAETERQTCKTLWARRATETVQWCQRVAPLKVRLVTVGNLIWRYGVSQRDLASRDKRGQPIAPAGAGLVPRPSTDQIQRGVAAILTACPQANRWANMNEMNFPSWESIEFPADPPKHPTTSQLKAAEKAKAKWVRKAISLNLRYWRAIKAALAAAGRRDKVAVISIVARGQEEAIALLRENRRQLRGERTDAIAMSTYPQVQGLKAPHSGAPVPAYPKDLRDLFVLRPKKSRVWITELSGYYRKTEKWPADEARQAAATHNIVSLVQYWARKKVVDTLLWYQWTENPTNPWDSALIDTDGRKRAAYDVLLDARR